MFEDINTINLPAGLTEIIGEAFIGTNKVESITIPSSVKILEGRLFRGWNGNAIINIEGKDSKSDFETIDKYAFCFWYSSQSITGDFNPNYLGK